MRAEAGDGPIGDANFGRQAAQQHLACGCVMLLLGGRHAKQGVTPRHPAAITIAMIHRLITVPSTMII